MAKRSVEINADEVQLKRKPNSQDWDKVRVLYLKGEPPEEICRMFPSVQMSPEYIKKKMTKEGVKAKKEAMDGRVVDNAVSIIEKQKIKVNNDCISLFNNGADVIRKLLANCKEELKNGNVSKGQARATAYNVDMLMSGVTKIQKGLRVAYGMDNNGKLYEEEPEVLIVEGINEDKI